jgi:hypothetical protein
VSSASAFHEEPSIGAVHFSQLVVARHSWQIGEGEAGHIREAIDVSARFLDPAGPAVL